MNKKQILVGTFALGILGAATLQSCTKSEKATDSNVTMEKSADAKCGEGKCGDSAKTKTDSANVKTAEGKCGEGKCGNKKK